MVNRTISAYYSSNITAMNGYLNTLLVELEGGTDYKAVVPISVDLDIDGLSGLTIGEIFTVDKRVLPKDYSDKSIGFIITNVAHEIVTNSWITKIQSQMCILDQEEKQLKSLQKAEKIFGDIYRQIIENKSDNYTSIKYYNLLAALVIDSLRGMYKISDVLGGDLEIAKKGSALYVRSALSEYLPGELDLGSVLLEYNRAYKEAFPLTTNIRQTTVQGTDSQGNSVTNITRNTQQSRILEINAPEVIEKSIKNTSYYNAMNPQIKAYFDQELNRVFKGFDKYGQEVSRFSWEYIQQGWKKVSRLFTEFGQYNQFTVGIIMNQPDVEYNVKAILSTNFFKIDINKAIDFNTGFLSSPIPFVLGYSYWTE
jgi:hypothetical protein